MDGVSLALQYEPGPAGHALLKTALTRGDGVTGEDVTSNVRTLIGAPSVSKERYIAPSCRKALRCGEK